MRGDSKTRGDLVDVPKYDWFPFEILAEMELISSARERMSRTKLLPDRKGLRRD